LQQEQTLRLLLEFLANGGFQAEGQWQGWQIRRVTGGRNNLLYRACGARGDLAIKFTVRDARDRAGREYGALTALRQAGLLIGPEPILLDRASYAQPVVVQTWLEGQVSATPPTTDGEWQKLVQHLANVHAVTPGRTSVHLPWATIHTSTAQEGKQRVREQVAHIPERAQPASLRALLRQFEACPFPEWPPAPITLCRLDNNVTNYIRRSGPWASVDWEYSGWGDPAFDVANLVTHVSFMNVSPSRWDWFAARYCELVEDESAALRLQVYRRIFLIWWVARLARYLVEIPQGQDRRLADWPADWQADIEAKYEHYLALAEAAYPTGS
jgi:aminoglycoside phosphotransferase (APT) family kinase protein